MVINRVNTGINTGIKKLNLLLITSRLVNTGINKGIKSQDSFGFKD
jgi:hypothetical protein